MNSTKKNGGTQTAENAGPMSHDEVVQIVRKELRKNDLWNLGSAVVTVLILMFVVGPCCAAFHL